MGHGHHHHDHEHPHDHVHEHRAHVDEAMLGNRRGVRALKLSMAVLLLTACIQAVVVVIGGSASLLADTIHNFGDALTAVPLLLAFRLSARGASRRFTYGLDRTEDLAGLLIVGLIFASGLAAAAQSIHRFLVPSVPTHLALGMGAAFIGYLGNEAAAWLRIRTGRAIGSAALIADGMHARADAWTSLGALAGLGAVALGWPLGDPIAGLILSGLILALAWTTGREIVIRLVDGVDPALAQAVRDAALAVEGVHGASDVRARWSGRRVLAELNVDVDGRLSVTEAHAITERVRHALLHNVPGLHDARVHADPQDDAAAHLLTAHHFGDAEVPEGAHP